MACHGTAEACDVDAPVRLSEPPNSPSVIEGPSSIESHVTEGPRRPLFLVGAAAIYSSMLAVEGSLEVVVTATRCDWRRPISWYCSSVATFDQSHARSALVLRLLSSFLHPLASSPPHLHQAQAPACELRTASSRHACPRWNCCSPTRNRSRYVWSSPPTANTSSAISPPSTQVLKGPKSMVGWERGERDASSPVLMIAP